MQLNYCAQFIAKPKAACAMRFSWTATSSNLGLWANVSSSTKPEVHNISQRRTEPFNYTCIKKLLPIGRIVPTIWSRTDKHAHHNTALPYRGQSNNNKSVLSLARSYLGSHWGCESACTLLPSTTTIIHYYSVRKLIGELIYLSISLHIS